MTDRQYSLAFLLRGDEILLAQKKRGFGAGKLNGAGGKVEPGETIKQAMIRECQEELTITPTEFRKVAYHDFILGADTDTPWHQWAHVYLVTTWEGEPTETEEMAPDWVKLNDIPYDQMWDDDIHWLPLVLAGKLLDTTFTFDSDEHMLTKAIREVGGFHD